MSAVFGHVRSKIVSGLLLVLPLLITLWLLRLLFGVIHQNVTPAVMVLLAASGLDLERVPARIVVPIVGIALTALFIYFLGLLAGNLIGRRLWSLAESAILRVPFVKGIYGAARQLLDALSVTSKGGFSKVVLVEYPRAGVWTVGFVTNDSGHRVVSGAGSAEVVAVFLPTSPNPTSGWVVLAPRADVRVLDMTIEDGMKLVVSGGIVMPAPLRERVDPWGSDRAGAASS